MQEVDVPGALVSAAAFPATAIDGAAELRHGPNMDYPKTACYERADSNMMWVLASRL